MDLTAISVILIFAVTNYAVAAFVGSSLVGLVAPGKNQGYLLPLAGVSAISLVLHLCYLGQSSLTLQNISPTLCAVILLCAISLAAWTFRFSACRQTLQGLPRIPIAVGIAVFILISIRWYDPVLGGFFTPGYHISHDSMHITASVYHLLHPTEATTNLAGYLHQLILTFYPLGGSLFTAWQSFLFDLTVFEVYPLTILWLSTLLLFPLYSLLLNLKVPAVIIIPTLFLSQFNYLNISFLNASVLSSTVIPIFVVLTVAYLTSNSHQKNLEIVIAIILAWGYLMYSYVVLATISLTVVITKLLLPKKMTLAPIRKVAFLLLITILLTMPNQVFSGFLLARAGLTSPHKEINVFQGMQGNMAGFSNPLQGLSLWISSQDYRHTASRVRNDYLAVIAMGLLLIITFKRPERYWSSTTTRTALILLIPHMILLTTSILITRSPYQNVKVMQNFSVLWPAILLLFSIPMLKHRIASISLGILSVMMIVSGFYAYKFVAKPMEDTLSLKLAASTVCPSDQELLVISRNEWAKVFFAGCEQVVFAFDRLLEWQSIIALKNQNQLAVESESCTVEAQYHLPNHLNYHYKYVLLDRCFDRQPFHNYQQVNVFDDYVLLERD